MSPLFLIADLNVLPSTAALTLTSLIFFGSVLLEIAGPVPVALGTLGATALTPKEKIKLVSTYFTRANPVLVVASLLACAVSFLIARTSPHANVAYYSTISAFAIMATHPYASVFLSPIQSDIVKLAERVAKLEADGSGEVKLTEEVERVSGDVLRNWRIRHWVRLAVYAVSWGSSLIAFAYAVSGRV